jgi:hypothetical protein
MWKEVAVAYLKKLTQQSCLEGEINDMKIQFVLNWPGYFEFLILMSVLQRSVFSGVLNIEGSGNVQT